MAADDQIKHVARLMRHTRTGSREILVDGLDYTILDETSPEKQVFLNSGAPSGGGFTISVKPHAIHSGEYLVYAAKNRNGSNKTLDHTGSTTGKLILSILYRDLNTNALGRKVLVDTDHNTDLLAADPTLVNDKFSDAYVFKVPDGERWQLDGLFQADLRTTA